MAIYLALRFQDEPFMSMIDFIAACGGDVDTLGAMAGAIWGARNGETALPREQLSLFEDGEHVRRVARELHRVAWRAQLAE